MKVSHPITAQRRRKLPPASFLTGALILLQSFFGFLVSRADAKWASRFSLAVGEEFNDNIYFTKPKDYDFITSIIPTLLLFYAPSGQTEPVFTASLSSGGQIYARNSNLSNFGENTEFHANYSYKYSPRLTFFARDSLSLRSETRIEGIRIAPPAGLPGPSGSNVLVPPSRAELTCYAPSEKVADNLSKGKTLTNDFQFSNKFLYNANTTFTAGYGLRLRQYIDVGSNEICNHFGVKGSYKWREHNFFLGFDMQFIKARDGSMNVVHDLLLGDDYFSELTLHLTPTLTVTGSTGLSVNAGGDGPGAANRSILKVNKIWESASLDTGVERGLGSGFATRGISETTKFFMNFTVRLTDLIRAATYIEYALFDTKDVDKTFVASARLQYQINSWLSSQLRYSYNWRDVGSGTTSSDELTAGKVYSNGVMLFLSANFDIWPRFGLGQAR